MTRQVAVAQNTSKVSQETFKTTKYKLIAWKWAWQVGIIFKGGMVMRVFLGIPSSVPLKDLGNLLLHVLQELGVDLNWSQIAACHKLGMMDKTIAKFWNSKGTETVFFNKKTLKDVDISCLLGNGIQDGNDITTRVQNDLRDGSQSEKKKTF